MRSRKTIATPPGATIREQLEDRNMTQKEFAQRMDMSEKHISKLINGEVRLTPDVALRLESVLGLPANFWNNLEARYQEKLVRVEIENDLDADIELERKMPYNEMSKHNWVPATKDHTERVLNLRRFFEVAKLGILANLSTPGIAYRRTNVGSKSDYVLAVWAQQAMLEARKIDTLPIDRSKLRKILPEIRRMTREDPDQFCPKMVELLSQCGIALVFLPHMTGSFLHGASFYDGSKIVLGLTVRGKDADKFWFSLFHELDHILEDHIKIQRELTDEEERSADSFSRDTLIPPDEFSAFVADGNFSQASIQEFAKRIDIHAGIVVGRMQNENIIGFNQCNGLKTKYTIE